jgi:hypothetical protein
MRLPFPRRTCVDDELAAFLLKLFSKSESSLEKVQTVIRVARESTSSSSDGFAGVAQRAAAVLHSRR